LEYEIPKGTSLFHVYLYIPRQRSNLALNKEKSYHDTSGVPVGWLYHTGHIRRNNRYKGLLGGLNWKMEE
jgi:hypothetical protein